MSGKGSFNDALREMLKERAGGKSKCLSCKGNSRRNENPPEYQCNYKRKAGQDVYSCDKYDEAPANLL